MSQGQVVSLLMLAAGVALLALGLLLELRARAARVRARVRCTLVGALMLAAGLALVLVHRLDRDALPRVLTGVQAAVWSAAAPHGSPRR
jgi:hypothetical protein